MASHQQNKVFINRPKSKSYEIANRTRPPPSNPVVRGLALHYLANLVAAVAFIQEFLWANAGFGALRDRPELEDIDPRYEPNVIKSTSGSFASEDRYLEAIASEDWAAKQPQKTTFYSALHYHEAYLSGRLTPVAVAEALLPLIRRDIKNTTPHSISFLSTKVKLVRKAAEASTARYEAGRPLSPLDGVPMAVKDEQDLTGYPKSLGSRLDFTNKDDLTSQHVQLWLDAGAICMGKTTMHELGSDTTNLNPVVGTPLNPNNKHYYCGGSSGGSAYAVAAGLLPFSMGNDGGGSIRVPSAYCGLFGLKTSHGRVSIRPTSNLAKSTGVAGPIAATMVDLELAYRVMAQPDPWNNDSVLFVAPTSVSNAQSGRKKVFGIYRTWFDQATAEVQKVCWKALDYMTSYLGYEIVDIAIPMIHEGQLAHAMTILCEITSGVPSVKDLTPANKILLSVGKRTPGIDFMQAQKVRNLLMQHLSHLYEQHPGMIIVTPTTPAAGWHINPADLKYGCTDANKQLESMTYVWLANFTGCPAINVPAGYVDPVEGTGKVPVGLMGMGEWCSEDELLAFGYDAEKYLEEGLEGGRIRPETFVDVIELARGADGK